MPTSHMYTHAHTHTRARNIAGRVKRAGFRFVQGCTYSVCFLYVASLVVDVFFRTCFSRMPMPALWRFMEVFWICSVANHQARFQSAQGGRQRCTLPSHPFLLTALNSCNLQLPQQQQKCGETASFQISGIMLADYGIAASDVLSQYAYRDEFHVWQLFFRDAPDLYSIVARHIFKFEKPFPIFTCTVPSASDPVPLQRRRNALSPFLPYGIELEEFLDALGHSIVTAGGAGAPREKLRLVLERWGRASDKAYAVPVIEPICEILLQGKWSTVCLRRGWATPETFFPGCHRLQVEHVAKLRS